MGLSGSLSCRVEQQGVTKPWVRDAPLLLAESCASFDPYFVGDVCLQSGLTSCACVGDIMTSLYR
jgi:hypothetical protein